MKEALQIRSKFCHRKKAQRRELQQRKRAFSKDTKTLQDAIRVDHTHK